MRSADGKLRIFYSRETDEFFTVAPETKPDDNLDEEDEEQSSLLQEASRLAHSVRVVYLCDARRTDRSLQVFEDDLMNTDTEAVLPLPKIARDSHDSTSTARPEGSRGQAQHHTVSAEPSEDEGTSQQSLPTEEKGEETPDGGGAKAPNEEDERASDDEDMPDDPPPGSGEGSPDAASQREGGKVRAPEGKPPVF